VVDVPAEEVAQWLGVGVDGALVCDSTQFRDIATLRRAALTGAVLLSLLNAVRIVTGHADWMAAIGFPGWLLLAALQLAELAVIRGHHIQDLRATPTELDVRTEAGWRKYAWSSFQSVQRSGNVWVASTADGDLWLPTDLPHLPTLLSAIRHAIDARQRGLALPRMSADIPDSALSRAGSDDVSIERGLSRADDA
jgi:hypothetical protein